MLIGTSHFVSRAAAIRYYRAYEFDQAERAVDRKLAAREIHLGAPKLERGQSLSLTDSGTRYAVEDGAP